MLKIVKEVRDFNRFRGILSVLFDEGFDFLIDRIKQKHNVPFGKQLTARLNKKRSSPIEVRLRHTLERLGPTFIKFGQMLSVRPDLIPNSYIKELEKLQDDVPSFKFELVKEQVKAQLGSEITEIFSSFEHIPIASASISQVHKAVLKTGEKVAVKMQRPEVSRILDADIDIMYYFAKKLEKNLPATKKYSPIRIVEEFASWTKKELDFKLEARNAERFARNFSKDKDVKIPKIYPELTTRKILVMEYIEGIELHNIAGLKGKKINVKNVLHKGFEAILDQVFIHGFFHADPHPGNILVTEDNKVVFVDFGIVGHFDKNLKEKSIDLFYGVIMNDPDKVVEALSSLSNAEVTQKDELSFQVSDILDQVQESKIKKFRVSKALESILSISIEHGLRIPMEFVLFGKTVITLEGIAMEYDPKFGIVENSKPYIEKLIRKRYNPGNQIKSIFQNLSRFKKFADTFPDRADAALKRIEKGSIKVDIEDTDVMKLSEEIDRSGNRIAYSMLIAAFLLVGAMTINFGNIVLFNLPLLSLLSFLIAGIIGSKLIMSMWFNK
jgi:ubiquinone biosynthesis protein